MMRCPVCKRGRCEPEELCDGLEVVTCPACGGHWIPSGNYSAWLKEHGEGMPGGESAEIEIDVSDVHGAKVCPDCEKILLKYKVGHGLEFFIDHCPGCGSIWLDKGEWEALQAKNLHDEIRRVLSAPWQRKLRDVDMREKVERAYANWFGPDTYEEAKEIRRWLQDQPQRKAILAFLGDDDPYDV